MQQISGIGEALANESFPIGKSWVVFLDDIQLYEVYGLEPAVVQRTLNLFTVKTPKELYQKLMLIKRPLQIFQPFQASLLKWQRKSGNTEDFVKKYTSIQELDKIEGMTERKLQLIQLYLSVE